MALDISQRVSSFFLLDLSILRTPIYFYARSRLKTEGLKYRKWHYGYITDIMYDEYLIQAELCDWENKEILRLATELKKKSPDDRVYAVNAFYWVRDNILYGMGIENS